MKCPFCLSPDTKVVDSRPFDEDSKIRRRRECAVCLKRFTTIEDIEKKIIMVVKRDNSREFFSFDKLFAGMLRACEKRPVSVEQIKAAAKTIEALCLNSSKEEISTREIGEMVMEKLKALDDVAYVRFASVYRQFKDINTFMAELKKMLDEK